LSVLPATTFVARNLPVALRAIAWDPDGDSLAYSWEFDDGSFGPNVPMIERSWNLAGDHPVRCVVSDMKGGRTTVTAIVTVGTRGGYRLRGRVTAQGKPLADVRITADRSSALTDSDGTYTLLGIFGGPYAPPYPVSASRYGWTWSPSGFTNPLTVAGDLTGIDFTASPGDDRLVPRIEITAPTSMPAWVADGCAVELGGFAADDVRVARVAWRNERTGTSGEAVGTDSWAASIPLVGGENPIIVTAYDVWGHLAEDRIRVTAPLSPPAVRITAPRNDARIGGRTLLSAEATDDTGIASVTFSIDGRPVGTATNAPYLAFLDARLLSPGTHVIRAVARNLEGNTCSDQITVVKPRRVGKPPGVSR
jgi:hypothetical protein